MFENVIDYPQAKKWYKIILQTFHFDKQRDIDARNLLYNYRLNFDPSFLLIKIEQEIKTRKLIFFGAGPSLELYLMKLKPKFKEARQTFFIVAADGAARALEENEIIPNLIISDLDGLSKNTFSRLLSKNSIIVVHAHGDNIEILKSFENILNSEKLLIGTTQTKPKYPILNPGGFTDGDRGIFICNHLTPKEQPFFLIGYDFGDYIGKYSKESLNESIPISPQKKMKLALCKDLLDFLQNSESRTLYYLGKNILEDQKIIAMLEY